MQIAAQVNGFATYANAIKALDKALVKIGRSRDNVRWLVSVNEGGRMVPAVQFGGDTDILMLAHLGISVI
jgi:hypothetical protein